LKKYFAFIALLMIIVFTFTGEKKKGQVDESVYPLVTVECKKHPIPRFKLGYDANPSEEELDKLCACIWSKLVGWEKQTAVKLSQGKKDEINAVHMAGFPAIFGKRISQCGGEKL